MNLQDSILSLVQETLKDLESNETSLTAVIHKAIRIARLRNDFENLLWLKFEVTNSKKNELLEACEETVLHLDKQRLATLVGNYWDLLKEERKFNHVEIDKNGNMALEDKKASVAISVSEVEKTLELSKKHPGVMNIPTGLPTVNTLSLYFSNTQNQQIADFYILEFQKILDRIGNRVYNFLGSTEKQLINGQVQSNIFERYQEFVDIKLGQLCPDVLKKFVSAYRRLGESEADNEAKSHALTSCRRILKSLADALYPAQKKPVVGYDGKQHLVNDSKFSNRLLQYIWEKTKGKTSGRLLLTQMEDCGNKIERLNDLASKGVHDEVSKAEVEQCIAQTYLLCGDILRLSDN